MADLEEMSVHYVIDASGARRAVILSLDTLFALIEDLQDLAMLVERRDEPAVSHQDLISELKRDGFS